MGVCIARGFLKLPEQVVVIRCGLSIISGLIKWGLVPEWQVAVAWAQLQLITDVIRSDFVPGFQGGSVKKMDEKWRQGCQVFSLALSHSSDISRQR